MIVISAENFFSCCENPAEERENRDGRAQTKHKYLSLSHSLSLPDLYPTYPVDSPRHLSVAGQAKINKRHLA